MSEDLFEWAEKQPTLLQARKAWSEMIDGEGGHCPCCERWGRIYKRGINETMAMSLIWLCVEGKFTDAWIDVPNTAPRWLVRSNQLATLRWWGMVERMAPNSDDREPDPDREGDNKHSGMWRGTLEGFRFVRRETDAPEAVFTYNAKLVRVSDERVYIDECMGKKFSYRETMGNYA